MSVVIKGVKMPRCCEVCPCNDDNWRCGALGDTFEDLELYDLEHKPSRCPLVEVLRCKDCKWWTKQEDSLQGRCALMQSYPTGAWYCANGERKEK